MVRLALALTLAFAVAWSSTLAVWYSFFRRRALLALRFSSAPAFLSAVCCLEKG